MLHNRHPVYSFPILSALDKATFQIGKPIQQ